MMKNPYKYLLVTVIIDLLLISPAFGADEPKSTEEEGNPQMSDLPINWVQSLLLPDGYEGRLKIYWKPLSATSLSSFQSPFPHQRKEDQTKSRSEPCQKLCGPRGSFRLCFQRPDTQVPVQEKSSLLRAFFLPDENAALELPQQGLELEVKIDPSPVTPNPVTIDSLSPARQPFDGLVKLASLESENPFGQLKNWNIELTAGRMITDSLGEQLIGQMHFDHTDGLAALGFNYRNHQPLFGIYRNSWWWPRYEAFVGLEWRDDGEKEYPGLILAPLTGRWILPMEKWGVSSIDLSFFVREGISYTHEIPETETISKGEKSHRFMNHLGIGFEIGFPGLAEHFSWLQHARFVVWNDHRSDMFGVYPEDSGSNNIMIGLSLFSYSLYPSGSCR